MRDCDVGHEWQGRCGPEGLQCAVCGVTEAELEQYERTTAARRQNACAKLRQITDDLERLGGVCGDELASEQLGLALRHVRWAHTLMAAVAAGGSER